MRKVVKKPTLYTKIRHGNWTKNYYGPQYLTRHNNITSLISRLHGPNVMLYPLASVNILLVKMFFLLLLHSLIFLLSEYIQELLSRTCELCESDTEQSSTTVPGSLCSDYECPNKTEAIKRHKSRFKNI